MKKLIIEKWNIPEIKIYLGIVFVLSLIVLHFDWRMRNPCSITVFLSFIL